LHSSHKHAHAQAQDQQVEHHLRGHHQPGGLAECGDVTEAHGGEDGSAPAASIPGARRRNHARQIEVLGCKVNAARAA
jgi:hypothetical protein